MTTFLQALARHIQSSYGTALESLTVIVPNRRTATFFKRTLGQTYTQPIIAPTVLTMRQFIAQHTPTTILNDRLVLTALLFEAYQMVITAHDTTLISPYQNFANFEPAGKQLLADFEAVDYGLVEPQQIFRSLAEYRALDLYPTDTFDPFLAFQTALNLPDRKRLFEAFENLWNLLYPLYQQFIIKLQEKNSVYLALAIRQLIERKPNPCQSPLIFAGFYGCSVAELTLIDAFGAPLFIDIDPYFTQDEKQEAGIWFRTNRNKFRCLANAQFEIDRFRTVPKKVMAYGAKQATGLARTVGFFLENERHNPHAPPLTDVVVLVLSKGLLFPLLSALPEEVRPVNVTLGYPLRLSALYALFNDYKTLHSDRSAGEPFGAMAVLALLQSPYLGLHEVCSQIIDNQQLNLTAEQLLALTDNPLLAQLTVFPESPIALLAHLKAMLLTLAQQTHKPDTDHNLEHEFIYGFILAVNRLTNLLHDHRFELTTEAVWQLWMSIIEETELDFIGEPLKGLQVMGLQEAQNLAFHTVIVLGANEKLLPSRFKESFIPYNLRRGFGLAVQQDHEALQAYYLYRLVAGASQVLFVYNTALEETTVGSGEPTRYINQAVYEWPYRVEQQIIAPPVNLEAPKSITLTPNPTLYARFLEKYSATGTNRLSATALNTYLKCPLQFFLKEVLSLSPPKTLEEDVDGGMFGSLWHQVMELTYKPLIGQAFSKVTLPDEDTIRAHIAQAYQTWNLSPKQGEHYLYAETLLKLTQDVLLADRDRAQNQDFEVYAVELSVTVKQPVADTVLKLGGKIDRIDRRLTDNTYLIIDYKTGTKTDLKPLKEATLHPVIENYVLTPRTTDGLRNKYEPVLQLLFYAWLLGQHLDVPNLRLNAGLFSARKSVKAITWLTDSGISNSELQAFEAQLIPLLERLLNYPEIIQQTSVEKFCEFCVFSTVCRRGMNAWKPE